MTDTAGSEQTGAVVGALRVGGKYNWQYQPERLAYMGVQHYPGDRRNWHQFEKVDKPGVVWCEVLDADLRYFEETKGAAIATGAA